MLSREQTFLVVVDVQGKLAQLMFDKEELFSRLFQIIGGAKALNLPILWCEQAPDKMGPTIPEVADLLMGLHPTAKTAFSCWGEERFRSDVQSLGRKQVLLAGIETHVCVYQTAMEMVKVGYEVQVVADACSSRTPVNRTFGFERIREAGAGLTCVETCLMELLRDAKAPEFKEILKLIK
jgi:nicotinamidase-related amidase